MKNVKRVDVVGGGLAGCEAALFLAKHGIKCRLFEKRGVANTPVHKTDLLAELVCSNSLKSLKDNSAQGMLKKELELMSSDVYKCALACRVHAGGALAVDREKFSRSVTKKVLSNKNIEVIMRDVESLGDLYRSSIIVLATGPMTSSTLANDISAHLGGEMLSFFDAAAPIVMADSIDRSVIFSQNRYENSFDAEVQPEGDYLNIPMNKQEYENFINELVGANKVVLRDFETKDLFNACQPIEEIARKSVDAPRFGCMKPVGIIDPRDNKRPYAVVQLRPENEHKSAYNLVGFQTNLTFPEQARVFRMLPGLKDAEFARYGVMHQNIFLDAPKCLSQNLEVKALSEDLCTKVYVAGQLMGTEGYVEAIRSGLQAGLFVLADMFDVDLPKLPSTTVFGSLMSYATNPNTQDYQPMHVNFGIIDPLAQKILNKQERYSAYAMRGLSDFKSYLFSVEQAFKNL